MRAYCEYCAKRKSVRSTALVCPDCNNPLSFNEEDVAKDILRCKTYVKIPPKQKPPTDRVVR